MRNLIRFGTISTATAEIWRLRQVGLKLPSVNTCVAEPRWISRSNSFLPAPPTRSGAVRAPLGWRRSHARPRRQCRGTRLPLRCLLRKFSFTPSSTACIVLALCCLGPVLVLYRTDCRLHCVSISVLVRTRTGIMLATCWCHTVLERVLCAYYAGPELGWHCVGKVSALCGDCLYCTAIVQVLNRYRS